MKALIDAVTEVLERGMPVFIRRRSVLAALRSTAATIVMAVLVIAWALLAHPAKAHQPAKPAGGGKSPLHLGALH